MALAFYSSQLTVTDHLLSIVDEPVQLIEAGVYSIDNIEHKVE